MKKKKKIKHLKPEKEPTKVRHIPTGRIATLCGIGLNEESVIGKDLALVVWDNDPIKEYQKLPYSEFVHLMEPVEPFYFWYEITLIHEDGDSLQYTVMVESQAAAFQNASGMARNNHVNHVEVKLQKKAA